MNRPLSRLATRAAYGASQLPRIAWYLGHGLAMIRIAQRAGGDPDAAAGRGELDGVAEQVVHDLLELRVIRQDGIEPRIGLHLEVDTVPDC